MPTGHLGPEKADDANAARVHAPVLQLCHQAAHSGSLSPVHRTPAASLILLLPSHIQEAQRGQAWVQWQALFFAAAIQQPSAVVHLVGHSAEQRVAPSWTANLSCLGMLLQQSCNLQPQHTCMGTALSSGWHSQESYCHVGQSLQEIEMGTALQPWHLRIKLQLACQAVAMGQCFMSRGLCLVAASDLN